jgi:hypothetical protein
MELFLNLLWLSIALGALSAWGFNYCSRRPQTRSRWLAELTALSCALVFLFFAVSLTDDLHADVILCDDCAAKRHHALAWDCCHTSHQIAGRAHHVSAAEPSQATVVAQLQLADRISFITTHIVRTLNQKSFFGRSPPRLVNS